MNITYENFTFEHILEVKELLDKTAGIDYLTERDLEHILKNKVIKGDYNPSFIAKDGDKIIAIRLTYSPDIWIKTNKGISFSKWKVEKESVAKFHCLYLDNDYRGLGIGPKLSELSINLLKKMNAKAILCYSWLESFNNSSQKYLLKYGFEPVALHKHFWANLDYLCSGCNVKPCTCTAEEMIYYIK